MSTTASRCNSSNSNRSSSSSSSSETINITLPRNTSNNSEGEPSTRGININAMHEQCALIAGNALLNTNTIQSSPLLSSSNHRQPQRVVNIQFRISDRDANDNDAVNNDTVSVSSSGGSTDGGDIADGWDPDNETYDESELDREVRYMNTDTDVDTLDPLDQRNHTYTVISSFDAPISRCTRSRLRQTSRVSYCELSESDDDNDDNDNNNDDYNGGRYGARRHIGTVRGRSGSRYSSNNNTNNRDSDSDYEPPENLESSSTYSEDSMEEDEHGELEHATNI
jgi:hypothetical protein